jgi:hypothetical protein
MLRGLFLSTQHLSVEAHPAFNAIASDSTMQPLKESRLSRTTNVKLLHQFKADMAADKVGCRSHSHFESKIGRISAG